MPVIWGTELSGASHVNIKMPIAKAAKIKPNQIFIAICHETKSIKLCHARSMSVKPQRWDNYKYTVIVLPFQRRDDRVKIHRMTEADYKKFERLEKAGRITTTRHPPMDQINHYPQIDLSDLIAQAKADGIDLNSSKP